MNKNILYWLQKEIPKWQEQGLINNESADILRASYGKADKKVSYPFLRLLITSLGTMLLVLGGFFIFAGFWYTFTPAVRFDWSIIFLIFAFIGIALALWKGKEVVILRELAGINYYFIIMLMLFLIGDTYYLDSTGGIYFLYVAILTLPIAYLLQSSITMAAYLITISIWSLSPSADGFYYLGTGWIWILLGLSLPFLLLNRSDYGIWTQGKKLLSWSIIIAIYTAFYNTTSNENISNNIILLANLSTITLSLGWLGQDKGFWNKSFKFIGSCGIALTIYLGTVVKTWECIAQWRDISILTIILIIGTLLLGGYYIWQLVKNKRFLIALTACLSFIVAICAVLAFYGVSFVAITIIFDIYVLLISMSHAFVGVIKRNYTFINMAIILIMAMVVARFFDSSFTFVQRGFSFVIVGTILILANFIYLKQSEQKCKYLNKKVSTAKANINRREIEKMRMKKDNTVIEEGEYENEKQ